MATTDILTIDEARAVIGAAGDQTYDLQLANTVTAITALIETFAGPVVQRTVTNELHDGGNYTIRLWQRPITSVTTVTEARGSSTQVLTAESFGSTPKNAYLYDYTTQQLFRRDGGYPFVFYPGTLNVQVTYVAGLYATTTAVDPRVKEAAEIALRHNWGIDHGSGNQTFGANDGVDGTFGRGFALPNRAKEILRDDAKIPGIA